MCGVADRTKSNCTIAKSQGYGAISVSLTETTVNERICYLGVVLSPQNSLVLGPTWVSVSYLGSKAPTKALLFEAGTKLLLLKRNTSERPQSKGPRFYSRSSPGTSMLSFLIHKTKRRTTYLTEAPECNPSCSHPKT